MLLFALLKLFQLWPLGALSGWWICFPPLLFSSTFLLSGATRCSTFIFHLPTPALEPLLQGILVPFSGELYLPLCHCDSLICALILMLPH